MSGGRSFFPFLRIHPSGTSCFGKLCWFAMTFVFVCVYVCAATTGLHQHGLHRHSRTNHQLEHCLHWLGLLLFQGVVRCRPQCICWFDEDIFRFRVRQLGEHLLLRCRQQGQRLRCLWFSQRSDLVLRLRRHLQRLLDRNLLGCRCLHHLDQHRLRT